MATGAPATSPIVSTAIAALELVFDPVTRDLIDAPDGWFVEGTDSRSTVLWQLESRYQAWWGSPFDGSRILDILRGDDPATPQDLRDEVLRAMQALVDEGIVSDLAVATDTDDAFVPRGRPARDPDAPARRVIGIRLSDPEREKLKAAAGFEPLASWIRRIALETADRIIAKKSKR